MEHATIAGNYYLVTSKNGGTVTDSTGTLNKPIEAGDQLTVGAPSDKLLCDDEEAIIRRSNFKHALAALGLLGGGDKLPVGYTRLEFLESTRTQAIATGLSGNRLSLRVVSCHFEGLGGSGWGVACSSGGGSVFGIFANTIKSVGINLRKKDETKTTWTMFSLPNVGDIFTSTIDFTNLTCTFEGGGKTPYVWAIPERYATYNGFGYIALFGYGTQSPTSILAEARLPGRIYSFSANYDGTPAANYIPSLDTAGRPCMFDLVTRKPFYNNGTGSFIVGLTLSQARKLGKLPSTGGELTISLPSNWQEDEAVINALATAEGNGWVLTYQTYEAEGALSTFALRRLWVRKVQDDNGSYVAADGSRWQVEWCAGIVGADPAERGYEPFRSVDVAVAYWELVPYVDPNAEELLTETE